MRTQRPAKSRTGQAQMTARPSQPKTVTPQYLQASAMHYLSGRMASVAMLRATLERRAMRRLGVRRLEPETAAMIGVAVDRLETLGLVNDAVFAESRTASLARRGLAKRQIGQRLRLKGIDAETANAAIADRIDDRAQARRFAERKRLGPWRRSLQTPETRRKDLGALARAGFGYAIAVAVIDGGNAEPED